MRLTNPKGLVRWGQVGLGLLQAIDALTIAGVAIGATVGTAALTGSPLLTVAVEVAMSLVAAASVIEGTHTYHNIYEGFKDEEEIKSQRSSCNK